MACHFSIKRLRGNDAVADQQYIRVRWNGLAQLGRGADQGNADAVGVQAIDGSGQGWRDRVHMNGNVPGARLCRLPCLIFHQCLPCKDKGSPKRAVTMVQGGTCRNDSRKGQGRIPNQQVGEAVLFATQPWDCNPFGSRSLPDQDISNAAIADLSLRSMTGSPGAHSPASSDRDIKPTTTTLATRPLRRNAAICQLASQRALSSSAIWRCALSRKAWRRSTISTGSSPTAAARAASKAPGS